MNSAFAPKLISTLLADTFVNLSNGSDHSRRSGEAGTLSWALHRPVFYGALRMARLLQDGAMAAKLNRVMFVVAVLHHPLSRGSIRLRPKRSDEFDWNGFLDIDVAWLRDERDLESMVWGLKQLRESIQQGPLKQYVEGGEPLPLPGIHGDGGLPRSSYNDGVGAINDARPGTVGQMLGGSDAADRMRQSMWDAIHEAGDERLKRMARFRAGTTWHYSCTARMGPLSSPIEDGQCACDPRMR